MDVFKIIEATGAEIACNRAIARIGDKRVVVAKIVGDAMVLTAEGEELAKAPAAEKTKTSTKRKPAPSADTPAGDNPGTPDVNEARTDGDS